MKYEELKDFLLSNADKKLSEFSKTLSNSDYKVIGVKNPILRDLIKQHVNDEELKTEDFKIGEYLEIDFIYYGLSLSRLKNIDDQFAFLKKNIGKEMVLHGFNSLVLQKEDGTPGDAYSIASGLDYPGVGPEHAFLKEIGRVKYEAINDDEAAEAFFLLSRLEGIIPAIESSHALAYAIKCARSMKSGSILVNLEYIVLLGQ